MKQFVKNPKWNSIQEKILFSSPNLIVNGCPGSGKTLLACHIAMKYDNEKSVAILVFTKSLRTFIRQYIDSFSSNNIEVLYEHQWRKRDYPKYDIIIVDEFQDFSLNDVNVVINRAKEGVYLFGDIGQRLYEENFLKEKTISLDELKLLPGFNNLNLNESFRFSPINNNLITTIYKHKSIKKATTLEGEKPKIYQFESIDDELNWIKDFILNNKKFESIGILLKQNDTFIGKYFYNKKIQEIEVPGIMDLKIFLNKQEIDIGFKYKHNDNLDFTKKVNIMTYHSSKGLQFDCIIIPFSNSINTDFDVENLSYVGLTRAKSQIIISYTDIITKELSKNYISHVFYDGEIRKEVNSDKLTPHELMEIKVNEKVKKAFEKGFY